MQIRQKEGQEMLLNSNKDFLIQSMAVRENDYGSDKIGKKNKQKENTTIWWKNANRQQTPPHFMVEVGRGRLNTLRKRKRKKNGYAKRQMIGKTQKHCNK